MPVALSGISIGMFPALLWYACFQRGERPRWKHAQCGFFFCKRARADWPAPRAEVAAVLSRAAAGTPARLAECLHADHAAAVAAADPSVAAAAHANVQDMLLLIKVLSLTMNTGKSQKLSPPPPAMPTPPPASHASAHAHAPFPPQFPPSFSKAGAAPPPAAPPI